MSGRLVGLHEVGRVWVFLCMMNFMFMVLLIVMTVVVFVVIFVVVVLLVL